MKKVMLGILAMAFAATSAMAHGTAPVKKAKAKQATCTSCPKGKVCDKADCHKANCCK